MHSNNLNIVSAQLGNLSIGKIPSKHNANEQAPELPPKPKLASNLYRNIPGNATIDKTSGLSSYYAVNAPAPGTVGVASARVNHAYTVDNNYDRTSSPMMHYQNMQMENGSRGGMSQHDQRTVGMPHNSFTVSSMERDRTKSKAMYSSQNLNSDIISNMHERDGDFPPPPEGLITSMSPPSPVSSSYSELLNAHVSKTPLVRTSENIANRTNEHQYAPHSLTSSAYESLYEPISPRPSSQMSSVSIGSYAPYNSSSASTNRSMSQYMKPSMSQMHPPTGTGTGTGKEAEVDALTNLLVQSMDNSADPDFFGLCGRCGERVMGEGRGCTAMDQVFHVQCFCCAVCLLRLQGKPFYAMDAKPYCEECYMNTLEMCCVCTRPILERILRATGKPYHPACFTCVVCSKNLDGIPFTVDASNQIHCIDDFHKKFAPRCSVCSLPIMPEQGQEETVRVVALDRSFHVDCYKCEDCGLLLSSEAEGRGCYPLDKHVLCKSCNASRVQQLTHRVTTDL